MKNRTKASIAGLALLAGGCATTQHHDYDSLSTMECAQRGIAQHGNDIGAADCLSYKDGSKLCTYTAGGQDVNLLARDATIHFDLDANGTLDRSATQTGSIDDTLTSGAAMRALEGASTQKLYENMLESAAGLGCDSQQTTRAYAVPVRHAAPLGRGFWPAPRGFFFNAQYHRTKRSTCYGASHCLGGYKGDHRRGHDRGHRRGYRGRDRFDRQRGLRDRRGGRMPIREHKRRN